MPFWVVKHNNYEQDKHDVNLKQCSKHEEKETLKFLTSKQLPQDKL